MDFTGDSTIKKVPAGKLLIRRRIFILPLCVLLLGCLFVVYFFTWRPSDNNYKDASTQLQSMQASVRAISDTLDTVIYPGLVDGKLATELQQKQEAYLEAANSLSDNPVVHRDLVIRSAYSQVSSSLSKYQTALNDLISSVNYYVAVVENCNSFATNKNSLKGTTAFNQSVAACKMALANARQSPKNAFYDKFLNQYVTSATSLVDTYSQLADATTAPAIKSIEKDLVEKAGSILTLKTTEFSLRITPDPTNTLTDLLKDVQLQNKATLR